MITQSGLDHIKDSSYAVIHPIYKEKNACTRVSGILGYDFGGQINKDSGAVTKINTMGKIGFEYLYFVGMGYADEATPQSLVESFGKALASIDEKHAVVDLKRVVKSDISFSDVAYAFTKAHYLSSYDYKKKSDKSFELISKEDVLEAIEQATLVAGAINKARTLANTPSNLLTPLDLESYAISLSDNDKVSIQVLDNERLKTIGAGGILGVNKGSDIEARLIVLKYNGAGDADYTALVGKGVTFDTGGYNLKSSASMANMKSDMHGAASVLSAFEIIVKSNKVANVYCVVPATENMINGSAYKADDVLVMLGGKTVEITNTDAEGRLILADAITYVQNELGVKRIIDVATLTGAAVVGLGSDHSAVWANNEEFYEAFNKAVGISGELVWRMPLHSVFNEVLKKSIVADLVNSAAPKGGGANVAAAFLQEFVNEDVAWIHLDIAGTSDTKSGSYLTPKGATGVMVETLASLFD
jgi:leucyl aminopeptidase